MNRKFYAFVFPFIVILMGIAISCNQPVLYITNSGLIMGFVFYSQFIEFFRG